MLHVIQMSGVTFGLKGDQLYGWQKCLFPSAVTVVERAIWVKLVYMIKP